MLTDPSVEALFIVWFCVLAVFSLVEALRPQASGLSRVGALLHLLMCIAMALMTHPQYMDHWQLHGFFFIAASLWFVLRRSWYHAFMMAAMSWMTWVMLVLHSHHAPAGMHDAPAGAEGHHAHASPPMLLSMPVWMTIVTVAVVALFCSAAVLFTWRSLGPRRLLGPRSVRDRVHSGMQAGMAAGMAFGFVGM